MVSYKILVAMATKDRPKMLKRALMSCIAAAIPENVKLHILVGDNSPEGNAIDIVQEIAATGIVPISHCVVKEPGIATVRNELLHRALRDDFDALIFIDDDEWLDKEYFTKICGYFLSNYNELVAVQGPVYPVFAASPPKWLPTSLYKKPGSRKTGARLRVASTNNVIINLNKVAESGCSFDVRMSLMGGEDTDFFRRLVKKGHTIHWCQEAKIYEEIPTSRVTASWLVKRYFRRGIVNGYILRKEKGSWKAQLKCTKRGLKKILCESVALCKIFRAPSFYVERLILICEAAGLILGGSGLKYYEYTKIHGE